MNTQPLVSISYSHKDGEEKDRLLSHLGVLQRAGLIDLWSDDRISAGTDWRAEISQAITQAKVAILLITADFLNSEFIQLEEIPAFLERHQSEELRVFPLIARDCAWKVCKWLADMDVRPKNGKPVWGGAESDVDTALANVAREVAEIIEKVPSGGPVRVPLPTYAEDVRRYRTALAKRLEDNAANQASLDYIRNYIELNVAYYGGFYPSNEKASENLLKMLRSCEHKNILLLGQAGGGKTAALKRFAWDLVQDKSKAIPIIINLGGCGEESITRNIIYELQRYGTFLSLETDQDLEEFLKEEVACYFLFDGLNEIPPARQEQLLAELNTFLWDYSQYAVLIVITSRPQSKAIERLAKIDDYLMLQPLDEVQINEHLPGLGAYPRIYALARNPTMLALIRKLVGVR